MTKKQEENVSHEARELLQHHTTGVYIVLLMCSSVFSGMHMLSLKTLEHILCF